MGHRRGVVPGKDKAHPYWKKMCMNMQNKLSEVFDVGYTEFKDSVYYDCSFI